MVQRPILEQRAEVISIAARFGAYNIRVLGSMAFGTARDGSDIDLLVDFEPGRSLMDHAGLTLALQDLLGRSVDIGTTNGLRSPYKERILQHAIPL